ncbi:MAG: acyltransferase [Clostridiales bacterium]|nr:acyltransferase [Clostridiales bacterium]
MKFDLIRVLSNLYRKCLFYEKKDFNACGKNVLLNNDVYISNPKKVEFISNIYVGPNSRFFTEGGLLIKSGAVIGENVTILTSNHYYDKEDLELAPFDERNICGKVIISENTWIGSNTIILPGVNLAKGCVVGAGSIVTKSFKENSIIAGNPAKIIKTRYNKLDNIPSWVEKKKKGNRYILK